MTDTLTFSLPTCLKDDTARADFRHQLTLALATGQMPKLCLTISPKTSTKDIYQAIQTISEINKYLEVTFQLLDDVDDIDLFPKDHPAWGYLKICQSWLPNAHVVM